MISTVISMYDLETPELSSTQDRLYFQFNMNIEWKWLFADFCG